MKLKIILKALIYISSYNLFRKLKKVLLCIECVLLDKTTYYPNRVIQFEEKFKSFIGSSYSLTFCNGTSALDAILYAFNIGKGDEVIVTPLTFHSSVLPIVNAGANIIFADIMPKTLCLDPASIVNNINKRTKAIIVVHLFGNVCQIDQIKKLCKTYNLILIEDCSHAHGATFKSCKVGSFSDAAFFSLQGSKPISAGEGGIAVTDSKEIYSRMSYYGHFNRSKKYFTEFGLKNVLTGYGRKLRANPLGISMSLVDLSYIKNDNSRINSSILVFNSLVKLLGYEMLNTSVGSVPGGFFGGVAIITKNSFDADELVNFFNNIGINANPYRYPILSDLVHPHVQSKSIKLSELVGKLVFVDRRLFLAYNKIIHFYIKINVMKLNEKKNRYNCS